MDGKDILSLDKKQLAEHRIKNIGFIFQDYNLLETLTVKENIILPLALSGHKAQYMDKKLAELAEDLGITSILDKYPYEISGGEQQRAAACRALITNPKIILADEPTGNLDSRSSRNLLELLALMNREYGATILMVTHDVFAASYCRRILFIRDGEIYNQLYAGCSRRVYDSIIDVISKLGGGWDETFNLAFRNIKRNFKKYAMYFLTQFQRILDVFIPCPHAEWKLLKSLYVIPCMPIR